MCQQHSVVDLFINDIRVQDKVAHKAIKDDYFDVLSSGLSAILASNRSNLQDSLLCLDTSRPQ